MRKRHLVTGIPRQREGASPVLNLASQLDNLRLGIAVANVFEEQLELGRALLTALLGGSLDGLVDAGGDGDGTVDNIGNADEVVLSEATGGHGRSTHAQTAGDKGRAVTGDGVLVSSDADQLKDTLNATTVDAVGLEISQNQVVVSTTADQVVAKTALGLVITQSLSESLGIGQNLRLVGAEVGSLSLLKGNGQSGDGVVVRTTLVSREDGGVDGTLEVVHLVNLRLGVLPSHTLAEEDEGSTRSSQALVGGGGDDISVLEGAG